MVVMAYLKAKATGDTVRSGPRDVPLSDDYGSDDPVLLPLPALTASVTCLVINQRC